MAGPDKNTHRSDTGGDSSESPKSLGQTSSSAAPKSLKEQVAGFEQAKAGMAVETKMGMGIVIILVCAFGFLVYHKFDLRQRALLQASLRGKQSDPGTQDSVAAGSKTAADSQTPTGITAFQSSQSTADIPDSESFVAAADGFANEVGRTPLAATETRPAFNGTEPAESKLEMIPGADAATSQSPSTDPFAALAAQNAARLARKTEAPRTSTDDPFAAIPTPAPEPRRLFANAPSADGPPSSTGLATTVAPEFPAFGDPGNAAESPGSAIEPGSLPQTANLTPVNIVSNSQPTETLTDPAFVDPESDTFGASRTSTAALSTSTPKSRPLPPAFPVFDSASDTADASQGQDLPPVSPIDTPSFDQGTVTSEGTRPLRPVDDSSRQLIAMLEPQPEVDPLLDDRPVTKPAPALFDDSSAVDANLKEDPANPFGGGDLQTARQSELATASPAPSPQTATVAPATGEVEIGVARFHNPRQIQQVAGTSEPCEICEVKPNDNYWTISKRTYGTARYFSSLALYNKHRISDPRKLRPGMKVLIPDPSVLEERYPEFFRDQQRKPAQATGYFLKPDGTPAYRVGDRETLSEISQKHLGRASRWIQI
ncbi:MAG TPA: hypothetical protein EYQ63_21330, partial [Fuerstia sp.]|nr:hypothetical protein [Fuerstiella sp.]